MATKKVTVTLDDQQLDGIRALVAAGTARTVRRSRQSVVTFDPDDLRLLDPEVRLVIV